MSLEAGWLGRSEMSESSHSLFDGVDAVDADVDVDVDDQLDGEEGILAFRNGDFNGAVEAFTKELQAKPNDPAILLSNRCASYCRQSQMLRTIPASRSERNALYDKDPMILVQLALKDAEKLVKLRPNWPKAFLRKGTALVMASPPSLLLASLPLKNFILQLEQYDAAKEAFLGGLHMDAESKPLQAALGYLNTEYGAQSGSTHQVEREAKRGILQRSDDLDCTLCLKLLYSPITTPCGHSFCRACLLQAMDHGNRCPMCRTVLLISPNAYPVSVTLNNIIQRNFAEEYKERKAEMDELTLSENNILPLFVMRVVFPGEKLTLNIFEPRYRLMVRRIMEGSHRMGMVALDEQTGGLADIGCEVEICECEVLPDGRFYIEVEGRRRCKIVRAWEQDGYRVAQVHWVTDDTPAVGSEEYEQTRYLVSDASRFAETLLGRARDNARAGRRSRPGNFMNPAEDMPERSDPESFSFWLAKRIEVPMEKMRLIRMTNTRQRLLYSMELLRDSNPHGCQIQ